MFEVRLPFHRKEAMKCRQLMKATEGALNRNSLSAPKNIETQTKAKQRKLAEIQQTLQAS